MALNCSPEFCLQFLVYNEISKTGLEGPLKKNTKNWFQYRLSLNAGQKYCRMLQGEHSAILWTFIKLPFPINTFVLFVFKWPLKTGFTVYWNLTHHTPGDIFFTRSNPLKLYVGDHLINISVNLLRILAIGFREDV